MNGADVYSNEATELYIVIEHHAKHHAYPLLISTNMEPLSEIYNDEYCLLQDRYYLLHPEKITLGAVIHSADFVISDITWKQFTEETSITELITASKNKALEKKIKTLEKYISDLLITLRDKED